MAGQADRLPRHAVLTRSIITMTTAALAALAVFAIATPQAVADPPGGGPVVVTPNPVGPGVGISINDPGSGGHDQSGGDTGKGPGHGPGCTLVPGTSQCESPCVNAPQSQACQNWAIQDACNNGEQALLPPGTCTGTPGRVVDTAQLAGQAYGELRLPAPTVHRSPTETRLDPAAGNRPYTWVNLWTWFWADPSIWDQQTKTVSDGQTSATATARPTTLVIDPGDGNDPVTCKGPGRPWHATDANNTPTDGGCGYMYRHVSTGRPVTATVSVTWSVSWTGSDGQAGAFDPMQTQASMQFVVEQIQALNR